MYSEQNKIVDVKMLIRTKVIAILKIQDGGRPPSWISVLLRLSIAEVQGYFNSVGQILQETVVKPNSAPVSLKLRFSLCLLDNSVAFLSFLVNYGVFVHLGI